jgi:hypothetical protein
MTLLTRREASRVVIDQCQVRWPDRVSALRCSDSAPAAEPPLLYDRWPLLEAEPVEDFSGDPLHVSTVAEILATSAAQCAAVVSAMVAQPDIATLLAAFNIRDLQSGLYLAGPHGPTSWQPVPFPFPLSDLQQRYCAAPALIMLTGDVWTASHGGAGSGYAELLVTAGFRGYTLLQAAAARRLAGCAFCLAAGEVTVAARGVGCTQHLFTVAIGKAKAHHD